MANQMHTPPDGPPRRPAPRLYDRFGFDNLILLAERHYAALSSSPIAAMFPSDAEGLQAAARRQGEFLCGVLGGPPIYPQKYGPPRMRARHLPFPIDDAAREEWLRCFRTALDEMVEVRLSPEERADLLDWLEQFSAWMVNLAASTPGAD